MPVSNIPTFVDGEIPSAAKLNQLGDALTTKFSGGISGADLVWPLVAAGNINMNGYELLNLKTLWNIVNVDEYDTFALAAAAGSCLFIPPDTTVTTDGNTMTGAFAIIGGGKTSVLKLTSDATSGWLVRSAAATEGIDIVNLTIDGNATTGAGQDGIQIRNSSQVNIVNVWFKNFSGTHLTIGNDGTGGNNSAAVRVQSCHFEGGSGKQLLIADVDGLRVNGCQFENPTTLCIEGTPTDSNSKMRSITINDNEFSDCSQFVDIVGSSGTANDLWRLVKVCDNIGKTCSSDGITVGTTAKIIKQGVIDNNVMEAVSGDAIVALLQGGRIAGNSCGESDGSGPAGDGLDMTDCQDIEVFGNDFRSAGAAGIDATNSDDCRIHGNNVSGFVSEAIIKDGTTGNVYEFNYGDVYGVGGKQAWAGNEASGGTSGQFTQTYTIPAGAVKAGDRLRIKAVTTAGGSNAVKTLSLRAATVDLGAGQVEQSDGNTVWNWDVWITAVTNDTDSHMHMVTELQVATPQDNQQVALVQAAAVDWSTDTVLDLSYTRDGSDTFGLRHFTYEIF